VPIKLITFIAVNSIMKKITPSAFIAALLLTLTLQGCSIFKKKCDCPRFSLETEVKPEKASV
jgi:hypothetical protein